MLAQESSQPGPAITMMSPATVIAAMTPLALLTEEGRTWIQFFILLAYYGAEIVCFLEAWAILTMAIFGGLLACWRHYSYKIMEALNINYFFVFGILAFEGSDAIRKRPHEEECL